MHKIFGNSFFFLLVNLFSFFFYISCIHYEICGARIMMIFFSSLLLSLFNTQTFNCTQTIGVDVERWFAYDLKMWRHNWWNARCEIAAMWSLLNGLVTHHICALWTSIRRNKQNTKYLKTIDVLNSARKEYFFWCK